MKTNINNQQKKITVGLLWHSFSSNNLGVGALSVSNLSIIKSVSAQLDIDLRVIVLGTKCDVLKYAGSDEVLIAEHETITRKKLINPFSKLHRQYKNCDLIIDIGEGDSFADIYGNRRFFVQIISKLLCIFYSKKFILAPQTIGPFDRKINRLIAKFVINKASVVFTRDHLSTKFLERMGVSSAPMESIDVAFDLPYTEAEEEPNNDEKIRVGINISGLLYNGGYTKNNMFGLSLDYKLLIDKLIQYFSENDKYQVCLMSHVVYDKGEAEFESIENDYFVAQEINKKYPETILEPVPLSPSDAKSKISKYDLFLGARMHACIAAISTGVPVIPLAYSRKFQGLFESVGYGHVVDMCQKSDEAGYDLIVDKVNNLELLKKDLDNVKNEASTRLDLYKQQLAKALKDVQ